MSGAFFVVLAVSITGVGGAREQPSTSAMSDSSCVAAFDSLQAIFRNDYPGYREKVAGRSTQLVALTDTIRAIARRSDEPSICIPALQRWTRFFHDQHVIGPWQSEAPKPQSPGPREPTASDQANDPDRPSLQFVDDSTSVVRLPSFDAAYKHVIDSLIDHNAARLRAMPYLILDVRGNGGGYTGSYTTLIPFIYSGPIRLSGADMWASPANIAHYRELSGDSRLPAHERASLRLLVERAARHVHHFVVIQQDTIIRLASVLSLPRRIAVVMDSGCASSCEDFVLAARQSTKVTLIGTHSAGIHDYGEVRRVALPGWRRLMMPTSRAHGPGIDNVGITPAVELPSGETDALAFARRYLAARDFSTH
ncbi:MAG TPA: S41 family peptidase [Gemmatimonadaceae bacterium]|nr:S41 family peptidase [Gemmatimonadaceae bacterium]